MKIPESDAFSLIRRELALHDAAMESTSCGISISDARKLDMPLIYVNRAFSETGLSYKNLFRPDLDIWHHPRDKKTAILVLTQVKSTTRLLNLMPIL